MRSEKKEESRESENPLRIGLCSLNDLEDRIKAFRVMNPNSLKKRFILSRESIVGPDGQQIVQKSLEIDISKAKLLRRHFPGNHVIKTFQPDEGLVIVSDMTRPEGISLSMDLVTQIMNLGGGAYEGFIDRVDSFTDFLDLLKKALFPRLVVVGYFPPEKLEAEKKNLARVRRVDNYLRIVELTHAVTKPQPYFPHLKQIHIDTHDPKSWGRFIVDLIREYTKPYFVEDV